MPTRIVVVSAVDPYPTDAGKKVVLAGFLDYLVARYGPDSVHYLHVGEPGDLFPVPVTAISQPTTRQSLWQLATRTATGRASLQESLLRSPRTGVEIRRALADLDPGIVVYDTVRMAQYFDVASSARQLCYLDDLFSERYATMLRIADEHPGIDIAPLGNFSAFVPSALRPVAEHRLGWQSLLRVERRLIARSEDGVPGSMDRCLLISEPEAEILRGRTGMGRDRIMSVPPLVSEPSPRPRRPSTPPRFVFLGQLSLPHNDDGLRSFLASVWPLVTAAIPGARLQIIGRGPRPGLLEAADRHRDSVTFAGFVEDLGESLASATAMVNHLRFGSGIKLKVIESLGHALPVVSTSIGAHGIDASDGTGVLVADSAELFCAHLSELTNPVHNAEHSEGAAEHFSRVYSREAVTGRYDRAFGV